MNTTEYILDLAGKARAASARLATLSTAAKNAALESIARALEEDCAAIIAANEQDVAAAKASGLAPSMVDRLTLTPARFEAMVAGVRHVATLADPIGTELDSRKRPSGILIRKVRVPLGVIAVVFESRPNVFVDTAALCLKTGNAVILRGGKEAFRSNAALAASVRKALVAHGVPDAVEFVDILDHEAVTALVRATGLVDVAIPRGGERLIRAMCEAALVPVLKHYKGVCHLYVDDQADFDMALDILDNAKTQRPGVCNAVECLLVNRAIEAEFLPRVRTWAEQKGVVLHEGEDNDWEREFLSLELNVGVVDDVASAIAHINRYGSHHSDAIVTANESAAAKFLDEVDSACVYHNASTRFTDGAEFGLGAEIGISTDKLHARGPMGLEELTTYKYRVTGSGTVRKLMSLLLVAGVCIGVAFAAERMVYCKYCGYKAATVRTLTSSKCLRHPNGTFAGPHVLYEGTEKTGYVCKFCGRKAMSIRFLTSNKCQRHPNGAYKGFHVPAL